MFKTFARPGVMSGTNRIRRAGTEGRRESPRGPHARTQRRSTRYETYYKSYYQVSRATPRSERVEEALKGPFTRPSGSREPTRTLRVLVTTKAFDRAFASDQGGTGGPAGSRAKPGDEGSAAKGR